MRKMVIGFALGAMLFALGSVGALLLALSFPAEAQQAGKVHRVGFLRAAPPPDPNVEAIREGLRKLGYVEGQNLKVEYRYGEEKPERLPDLAAELVQLKVDVIVALSHHVALTAKKTTTTIPIVFALVNDPVGVGLVPSLARPGANVTGVSLQGLELIGKRLELLKESFPKMRALAYLRNPGEPYSAAYWKEVQAVARALGIKQVRSLEVQGSDDFAAAFAEMTRQHPDTLLVEPNSLNFSNRKRIAEFAVEHRLPSMYGLTFFMDAGGLMSYGPNLSDHFHRAAVLVDKILKGTKPADLPVEQPMKFEFVINLKTAKQIGLTIPPNVLARADKVIK
jgi:putative ABC transport system substrate-binding protein